MRATRLALMISCICVGVACSGAVTTGAAGAGGSAGSSGTGGGGTGGGGTGGGGTGGGGTDGGGTGGTSVGGGGTGGIPVDAGPDALPDGGGCPMSSGQPTHLWMNLFDIGKDSLDEDGVVVDKGAYQDPNFTVVAFGLSSTEQQFRIEYPVDAPFDIPVYVDQQVHLYVVQDKPLWTHTALVIHDSAGVPIFFFFDAARTTSAGWVTCGGKSPCPSVSQLPTSCPPLDATCGPSVFPSVELLAHGGLSSAEAPIPLSPGEVRDGFARFRYSLLESYSVVQMQCLDYPSEWIQASIAQPSCDPGKIAMTQPNPEQYDLYAVCYQSVPGFDPDALKQIDPTLQCNVGGGNGCAAGEQACAGMPSYAPGKAFSNKTWSKLCAMSTLDAVTRIVGMHYE